mgnify:CR=1 FL=1
MSFWNTSEGESVADTGTEFDAGGGNMEPIPNNTDVMAAIDEAKWDNKDGNEYISLRWSVLKPEAYINRKVFQKLWVKDLDPSAAERDHGKAVKKTDKAKRMLSAIDANAGGKLVASGQMPDNDALQMHLMNKPMVIKCMVWEMTGSDGQAASGNWIAAVSPKGGKEIKEVAATPKPKPQQNNSSNDDMDSIPF